MLHQFEDAPLESTHPLPSSSSVRSEATLRQPGAFIDQIQPEDHTLAQQQLRQKEKQEEEDDEEEYYDDDDEWNEEDEMDQRVNDMLDAGMDEINDQDWDVLSGGTFPLSHFSIFFPCEMRLGPNEDLDGAWIIRFHETV